MDFESLNFTVKKKEFYYPETQPPSSRPDTLNLASNPSSDGTHEEDPVSVFPDVDGLRKRKVPLSSLSSLFRGVTFV